MPVAAFVFDFDDTLAPDSTSSFLDWIGVDAKVFWKETVGPLDQDGWDPIPAYLYALIQLSNSSEKTRITRPKLKEFASKLRFHQGVTRMFPYLLNYVKEHHPGLSLEFYIISSGIGEIVRNTRIARFFTDIWASEFHYDEVGAIVFPRNVVSFTDKTRYLFQISKGLIGPESRADHYAVNRRTQGFRIPMDHMVFVGDGLTDIPCFSLVKRYGGVAIGVYDKHKRERWSRAWDFLEDGRVTNLLSADYSTNSDLMHNLLMAIDAIARKGN